MSYLPPGQERPPRRFATGAVVGGAVAGVVGTILLPLGLGALGAVTGPVAFVFGLLALLSVIAMAVFFRRRSRHSGHRLREGRNVGPWIALALGAVAGTVMSGWIGLAAVAVAAVCSWFLPKRVVLVVVAAVVTLGTLVAAVQPWPNGDAGVTSAVVQSSILFGCALALLSTFTGETSYDLSRLPRRMMGRSIP